MWFCIPEKISRKTKEVEMLSLYVTYVGLQFPGSL